MVLTNEKRLPHANNSDAILNPRLAFLLQADEQCFQLQKLDAAPWSHDVQIKGLPSWFQEFFLSVKLD